MFSVEYESSLLVGWGKRYLRQILFFIFREGLKLVKTVISFQCVLLKESVKNNIVRGSCSERIFSVWEVLMEVM